VIHLRPAWSPARLAQRVGRVDRAGSPHVSYRDRHVLPPRRSPTPWQWSAAWSRSGTCMPKPAPARAARLVRPAAGLADRAGPPAAPGLARRSWRRSLRRARGAAGASGGGVGRDRRGRSGGSRPCHRLLEQAAAAEPAPFDATVLEGRSDRRRRSSAAGSPRSRTRRWRAAHRDRLSRRLIPWVLPRHAARPRSVATPTSRTSMARVATRARHDGRRRAAPRDLLARRARSRCATSWRGTSACRPSRPAPRRRRLNWWRRRAGLKITRDAAGAPRSRARAGRVASRISLIAPFVA